MLRQQSIQPDGKPNRSLADFVAPPEAGVPDYVGGFAVTSGIEADDVAARFEKDQDDYRAIMVKVLADRLAEAFAEKLHARARHDWGYGQDESNKNEDLISERYRGIRPAFGYPACPDHLPKRSLFDLLDPKSVGIELTETCAMTPAASVSGLYFAHPDSRYFTIGRLGKDTASLRVGMPAPVPGARRRCEKKRLRAPGRPATVAPFRAWRGWRDFRRPKP